MLTHMPQQDSMYFSQSQIKLTRMFLSATKTLGAETTAMLVSDVAPSRSCLARRSAVSSEYCT